MKKIVLIFALVFSLLSFAPSYQIWSLSDSCLKGSGGIRVDFVSVIDDISVQTEGYFINQNTFLSDRCIYFDSCMSSSPGVLKKLYLDEDDVVTHSDRLNIEGIVFVGERAPYSPIFVDLDDNESIKKASRFMLEKRIQLAEKVLMVLAKCSGAQRFLSEAVRKDILNVINLKIQLKSLGGPLTAEDRRK